MEQPSDPQGFDVTGSVAVQTPPARPTDAPENDLRPPESWPGAAGRKSVAPDVPSWPGVRRSSDPGGTWPGMVPATAKTKTKTKSKTKTPKPSRRTARLVGRPGPLDAQAVARLREQPPAHRVSRNAKGLWALTAGLCWLAPLLLACAWVALDPAHRSAELALLGVIAVAAATHIVLMPRARHRIHRWEVTEEAIYTQSGALVRNRRIAPLTDVTEVRTGQGPLQAIFSLGTITVTTPGGRLRIADLSRGAVRDVSALIRERAGLTS